MNRRELVKMLAIGLPLGMGNVFGGTKDSQLVVAKKNLIIYFTELGFNPNFFPKGDKLDSSPLIKELKDHYNDMTLFRDIGEESIIRSHANEHSILSLGRKQQDGQFLTFNNFLASKIQQNSRYKQFHTACQTLSHMSGRKDISYMAKTPETQYKMLFEKTGNIEALKKRKAELLQIKKLVPSTDRELFKFYEEAVVEAEKDILIEMEWLNKAIPKVEFDVAVRTSDNHGRGYVFPPEQILNLGGLAVNNQRANIFMASPPLIDNTAVIKSSRSHHAAGHQAQAGVADGLVDQTKIETFVLRNVSKFINTLKKNKTLDNNIVLILGGFSDPGTHNREYVPTILVGGGFKHKGIVDCKKDGKRIYGMSALYVSIARQMGIDIDEFSQYKANLDHILT